MPTTSRSMWCEPWLILALSFLNPIALRKAKIVYNFGLSECSRVKFPGLRQCPDRQNIAFYIFLLHSGQKCHWDINSLPSSVCLYDLFQTFKRYLAFFESHF